MAREESNLVQTLLEITGGYALARCLHDGLQRSREQYAALLEAAGFSSPRQIDTRSDVAILESAAESE